MTSLIPIILLALPVLVPSVIPWRRALVAYLFVSSLLVVGVWVQSLIAMDRASGHHSPGDGLGLAFLTGITILHLAGLVVGLFRLDASAEVIYVDDIAGDSGEA